ncbi:MAG: colicin immunity domain-containing protein [Bacteroidales bacterium]|nr:colicin immunity domain-containing protein [Bacteroidales bacterium]
MNSFLNYDIPLKKFQHVYLECFKKEKRPFKNELLEELFRDTDMCISDNCLLSKYPEFYIDEDTLRKKADETLQKLNILHKVECKL